MASHISLVISGLLLVTITIVVQSIPIEKDKQIIQKLLKSVDSVETSSTTTKTTTVSQSSLPTSRKTSEKKDQKKKRYIDDDQLDGLLDNESDEVELPYDQIVHTLHPKIQETSVKIHDNADKPVDTDDSKVYSDMKMSPNELIDIVRRRRDVKLNDQSNRRRKRALLPYDFYDTDSFYDPYVDLIERQQYVRPVRSFAPLYWYPTGYERNIRSALAPSFYEPSEYPVSNSAIEDTETPVSIFNDENEDDNDYESNRYPILLQASINPFDNLQLQQQYNTDDLPIDEENDDDDDDDEEPYRLIYQNERPYYTSYGPIETDF
jgi:hypothetical protein